jgi:hypothetical protein
LARFDIAIFFFAWWQGKKCIHYSSYARGHKLLSWCRHSAPHLPQEYGGDRNPMNKNYLITFCCHFFKSTLRPKGSYLAKDEASYPGHWR